MRLEASREQMRGMTKQLDDLRLYLRDVLHELPLGACSVAADGNIYLWNSAMQALTGISERKAQAGSLAELPTPWNTLLAEFAESPANHRFRCPISWNNKSASVNLHKADIGTVSNADDAFVGQVILMEDRTDYDTLEAELAHSERLASIGRLAAGVAHEIGEQANDILNQVNRIDGIVHSLLTFSHEDKIAGTSFQPVLIANSVDEALRLVKLSTDTKQFDFVVDIDEALCVTGDPTQLVQVFVNLINNACDASPPNATIRINIAEQFNPSDESFTIAIEDAGSGIDPSIREPVLPKAHAYC